MANVSEMYTTGSKQKKGKTIDGTSTGKMAMAEKKRKEEDQNEESETPLISRDPEFLAIIRGCSSELDDIKEKRTELTAEKNLIYARFDIYGLNRKGVDAARSYVEMSEEQKTNFDLTVLVVREALGEPIKAQEDLFEAAARREIAASQERDKH